MPIRKNHVRRWLLASGAAAAAVAAAPSAASAACTALPTTKAFSKYGDQADYSVAPGGDFEGSTPWTLTGGAKIAAGNEPLGVAKGNKALFMPLASTATSPEFCVDETNPYFRFVMKSAHKGGYLAMVLWRNDAGQLTQAEFTSSAYVTLLESAWSPSAVSPLATKIPLGSGKAASVQLKLISTGNQNYSSTNILGTLASNVFGSVTIDSVMVDPYRRG